MDTYTRAAEAASARAMQEFSTSFSLASRLFDPSIRQAVCNVYGLVRIADEIVDTYTGPDQLTLLDTLETETYAAIERGYSSDLIVHAFAQTARTHKIDRSLIEPFFASMRTDSQATYTTDQYQTYIYGSAEVVGLMCLRVFVHSNEQAYQELRSGAQSLGAAFQKVNFLRDLRSDYDQLGRYYFPVGSYEQFDETTKQTIVKDIRADFTDAQTALKRLPTTSRRAVTAAYRYYSALLEQLDNASPEAIKAGRIRVSNSKKLRLLLLSRFSG